MKKKWVDNILAQGFYGEGFPCLGCPYSMDFNADLTHDDK